MRHSHTRYFKKGTVIKDGLIRFLSNPTSFFFRNNSLYNLMAVNSILHVGNARFQIRNGYLKRYNKSEQDYTIKMARSYKSLCRSPPKQAIPPVVSNMFITFKSYEVERESEWTNQSGLKS